MNDIEWLVERVEEQQDRLRAIAYRMLDSLTQAADAVQVARSLAAKPS